MPRYKTKSLEDAVLAREMAVAENPIRTEMTRAWRAGASIAYLSGLTARANRAARIAEQDYHARVFREAYDEIVWDSDTPVIDKALFESFWGPGASQVWIALQKRAEREPPVPIEFVPVVDDAFVLRGDLRTAAQELRTVTSGIVLKRIADYLDSGEGKWLLQEQGLQSAPFRPPDF